MRTILVFLSVNSHTVKHEIYILMNFFANLLLGKLEKPSFFHTRLSC